MPHFAVPGASLFYSIAGTEPLLLLVPGGGGTGNTYARVVPALSAHYTVISYDRRGFSQSLLQGQQEYSRRLERDADDAAALIEHVRSEQPHASDRDVYVFGSSSGAIIAQMLLKKHPTLIRKLVSHEPPLLTILPDSEDCVAETRHIYDIYRASGPEPAMEVFMAGYLGAEETEILKKLRTASAVGAGPTDPYAVGNQLYWFERELPVYPFVAPGWEELEQVKEKMVMATSILAGETPEGRAAKVIAERLKVRLVTFPGGHVGSQTHPQEWATALLEVLKGT